MVKIHIVSIEAFRESVRFLDRSSQAIFDCFDDEEFRKDFFTAVERCKDLANRLGTAEVTVKG